MCTGVNLNLKLITNHSSVFLEGFQNHPQVLNVGFWGCRGMTTELFIGLAKRTSQTLSQDNLNQCEPKETSGEEFDFVKAVAEESLPVALTTKQVELVSASDPEIASLGQTGLNVGWQLMCVSRMANLFCAVQELLFRRLYGELSCVLPTRDIRASLKWRQVEGQRFGGKEWLRSRAGG